MGYNIRNIIYIIIRMSYNLYIDTSLYDEKNNCKIILDNPIQVNKDEYLKIKVKDASFMNDNYNISSSLNNNKFIINRKEIDNIPVRDDPLITSPLFNAIDFYQTANGNSLASGVTRGHYDGYETLENGTFTIYYHNTAVVEGSNTHYIHNIFDNVDISQEIDLNETNETFFVIEDVLNTGYLFEELDLTISHNGNPIANSTTFTFRIAYSNDNTAYNQFELVNNTITFPAHSSQTLDTTAERTISLSQNNTPALYKYIKIYFQVNQTIPDDEYKFVKLRLKKADYTINNTTVFLNETITIPDGFYNSSNFISTLNSLLLSYNLVLSINSITNKLSIQNNNTAFVYSIFTPNDLNNELKIIFDNNLLKRIFGINANETLLPKQNTITSDNPINLLHHQKIIISTDLTFTNSTTNSLSSWKEDHDEGIRNILLWLNCDEPPFTIIKYNNYELIDYRIDDKFIKNLNLYFYNEYKKPIDINKMLLHIIIEKKNISYN